MVMRQVGGPNGPYVDFGELNDSQVDQIIQSGKLDNVINNPEKFKAPTPSAAPTPTPTTTPTPETDQSTTVPAPAVRTTGETPREAPLATGGALQPAPPGFPREAGIAAGQFVRGLASPFSIPGDLNLIASQASGGIIPQSRYLPTSYDLDRRILSPAYAPQGFWENELAAGSRGLGESATFPLMPAVGRAVAGSVGYPVGRILPTAAEMGRTMVSGAAGGAAGEAQAQLYQPDPLHPGMAAVGPVAASALGSGLAMGGMRAGADYFMGTPYGNVMNRLGVNLGQQTPLMEDAGASIKSSLENNYRAAVVNNQPAGAGGVPGTDLTQSQYDSIVNSSDKEAARNVVQGPKIAPILANELPSESNQLAAATIANKQWGNAHPLVKQAWVPDPAERAAVDRVHARQTTTPSEQTENIIARAVRGEYGGGLLGALSGLVGGQHADPTIHSLLTLAGYAAPYVTPTLARFLNNPQILRQTATGAFVGVPTAAYMTTTPGQYSPGTMPSGQQ